jgi:hypothetical protein
MKKQTFSWMEEHYFRLPIMTSMMVFKDGETNHLGAYLEELEIEVEETHSQVSGTRYSTAYYQCSDFPQSLLENLYSIKMVANWETREITPQINFSQKMTDEQREALKIKLEPQIDEFVSPQKRLETIYGLFDPSEHIITTTKVNSSPATNKIAALTADKAEDLSQI